MIDPYYRDKKRGITIYCGDAREVLPQLKLVDSVVTDPPYGMGRFRTDTPNYLDTVGPALQLTWTRMKDPASMFVFTSTREVLKRLLWMYKPADCTFPHKGWLLTSEAILWFAKGKGFNLAERRPYKHDCYTVKTVGREGVEGHPCVKPLAVIADLVSRCPERGTVLDPFMGSGTTLLAARNLGRKAIGIEIEPRYCEIAVDRLEAAA